MLDVWMLINDGAGEATLHCLSAVLANWGGPS